MKKLLRYFLITFIFLTTAIHAQVEIKGKVLFNNKPLEGAAVYLNNTIIGTTTNADGSFHFKTNKGQYELIISFLGFKTINYNLNTQKYKSPLVFTIEEDENTLDEIVIKKPKYDEEWEYNVSTLKRELIGQSELAKNCKLLNPKVLRFDFDAKANILTAYAIEPLRLKHNGLGYKITIDLQRFVINKNYVTYLGYSRYENLKGGKRKQRKWEKNRQKAYNGSAVHFFKSVYNNSIYEEGFIVHQFKRLKNPDRPSEEEIKAARELVKLSNSSLRLSNNISEPKTVLDSALVVLSKVRLPKFKDYLYKSKVQREDIITLKNNTILLDFDHNLSIVYTKEKEEKAYILRNAFSKPRKALPQTSSIIPLKRPVLIDRQGVLVNPLDIYFEGYWSFEKLADRLPLDYNPIKN